MTHIEIRIAAADTKVLVDGFDLTPHLLAEGFSIEPGSALDPTTMVHCVLVANSLDVDLPEGVLYVERQDGEA